MATANRAGSVIEVLPVSQRKLVISAVNLVEGGPLTVLQDCVTAAAAALPDWHIVVLAHRKALITTPGIEVLEFPGIKRRWLIRLWAEWYGFHALSKELRADLWLSLHDMTPRVAARRQAVYCHNAAPFSSPSLRDAWFGPSYFAFAMLYEHVYRPLIHRNYAVIVQQAWLRDRFIKHFGVKHVIVARPEGLGASTGLAPALRVPSGERGTVFFYPSLPRCFKNFEVIGEALKQLEKNPGWNGTVRWTIRGDENRYTRWLHSRFGQLRSLEWIGLQTRTEMKHHYQQADCLLFPSRLESWGLPITEAKEYGLPVLAADLPYARETVGNHGAAGFFDPLDAKALAQRMLGFSTGQEPLCPQSFPTVSEPSARNWPDLLRLLTTDL